MKQPDLVDHGGAGFVHVLAHRPERRNKRRVAEADCPGKLVRFISVPRKRVGRREGKIDAALGDHAQRVAVPRKGINIVAGNFPRGGKRRDAGPGSYLEKAQ